MVGWHIHASPDLLQEQKKSPGTKRWVGPRTEPDGCKKKTCCPTWFRTPNRSARIQSLYRPRIPNAQTISAFKSHVAYFIVYLTPKLHCHPAICPTAPGGLLLPLCTVTVGRRYRATSVSRSGALSADINRLLTFREHYTLSCSRSSTHY